MGCYKSDEEERREFFDTRTPEDPAYYSPRILDIHDYQTGEMRTKRGKEIMTRLRDMNWKEVLREYLRNWIKGMQMLHVVSTDFNTGNSSPAQYGWYPHGYLDVAYEKLLDTVKNKLVLADEKDKINTGYDWIVVERDLGYNKLVNHYLKIDIGFTIAGNLKKLNYKYKVTTHGDKGFYDGVFNILADELRAELETFKNEPLLKTDLRPYDTYPDITSYKDKRDQLGIIKYYMRYDTVGRRKNCKFTQGFIDAYKDARDFCKALPDINFVVSRDAFYYKGKKYTAEAYEDFYRDFPEEIKHLWQLALPVLVYKYGLLDTVLDHRFSKDTEVRQFIWQWRDKLHQPITDDIKAWVDKWIPKEHQKYVYED